MGLDVYLHRYEDLALHQKLEAEYEKGSEKNWDFGDSIELPSSKYPDHYFKIGYWRSSYNSGGINIILSNLGLPDLYEIMGRKEEDEYIWQPDWTICLIRIKDTIEQLRAKPDIRCLELSLNELSEPSKFEAVSEESAIKLFNDQAKGFRDDSDGYSNLQGHFFPKGLKIFGAITGFKKSLFGGILKIGGSDTSPCTYIIYEGKNEWYIQALEIMQETIEYVLAQPDKDKYFLHWSS